MSVPDAVAGGRAELRPAERPDVAACVEVFHRSMEALLAARAEPIPPRNSPPLARLFEHLIVGDPEGAWLAESAGSVVGFALAHRRGDRWFLAFLFVLPEWQSQGLGRALLERCLPPPADRAYIATCAEAIQPVSTALYARCGMLPRVPIYVLTGAVDPESLPDGRMLIARPFASVAPRSGSVPSSAATLGIELLGRLGAVDRAVLGFERPQDHQFWRSTGRLGLLFEQPTGAPSGPLGYGYVQPSGRLGPVLVRRPDLLAPALAHLVRAVQPPGAWQAIVPGPAADALLPLLSAGMRIDGGPAVYAASWSGPPFDCYLPMNHALV